MRQSGRRRISRKRREGARERKVRARGSERRRQGGKGACRRARGEYSGMRVERKG